MIGYNCCNVASSLIFVQFVYLTIILKSRHDLPVQPFRIPRLFLVKCSILVMILIFQFKLRSVIFGKSLYSNVGVQQSQEDPFHLEYPNYLEDWMTSFCQCQSLATEEFSKTDCEVDHKSIC